MLCPLVTSSATSRRALKCQPARTGNPQRPRPRVRSRKPSMSAARSPSGAVTDAATASNRASSSRCAAQYSTGNFSEAHRAVVALGTAARDVTALADGRIRRRRPVRDRAVMADAMATASDPLAKTRGVTGNELAWSAELPSDGSSLNSASPHRPRPAGRPYCDTAAGASSLGPIAARQISSARPSARARVTRLSCPP